MGYQSLENKSDVDCTLQAARSESLEARAAKMMELDKRHEQICARPPRLASKESTPDKENNSFFAKRDALVKRL